jgi:serine/threonine-protein kinase
VDGISQQSSSAAHDERYRVLGLLGTGGMGLVYEAVDTTLHRRVALKFARDAAHRHRAARQLAREAAAMALPRDARVCAVYDLAATAGGTCLVMERLIGCTLETRLKRGFLETSEIIDVTVQVAMALESVHGVGLVHQDVKPANIFLTTTGLVKLLDFGVATVVGTMSRKPTAARTAKSGVLGTPNYVAPERLLQRPADVRSDLFSLGAVAYEMATGRPPFAADSPAKVLFNVLDADPIPLRVLAPHRPVGLEQIVRKLLSRTVDGRYCSAAQVTRALRRLSPDVTKPLQRRLKSPPLH